MKKTLLLLTAILLGATTLSAQKTSSDVQMFNPVMTGVTSLTIAPDSRAGAMGDVGAATDPDVNSQYWNPAKYPFAISPAGFSLAYTPWLRQLVSDIDLANLVGYYRIGDYQAISGSLTYFSLGDVYADNIVIRPYEMALDFAYSRMLSETFSASVGLRYIVSDLNYNFDEDTSVGQAFAADIAFFYTNYVMLGRRECMLNLGLNASNIGSKISYDGGNTNQFIPTNLRLGTSLVIPVDEYNTFTLSADINKLMVPTKPSYRQFLNEEMGGIEDDSYSYASEYQSWLDASGYNEISPISGIFQSFADAPGGLREELQEIYWGAGVEYAYNNQFFLRGGYHYENEYKGNRKYFTLGTGFKMSVFSLDAAYLISMSQSNPLDQTLRFTLSFDMDGIKEILGR
ncbi:MAG: type IX secretion system outer membrane channel protein PorV [Bacteroidaceae bacterium]|nr:type IX secretion system outer membrane channel protein PorV [Bacteroidaceae bacterium]MBR6602301.1 type IX secretion system outer membrane channel protein PorV [Bacteroidaceae bacterium]